MASRWSVNEISIEVSRRAGYLITTYVHFAFSSFEGDERLNRHVGEL